MINHQELRLGNILLQKIATSVKKVACTPAHFALIADGGGKDLFPVVLKPELLTSCGFIENKDYPLAPQAREFILVLPVIGSNKNEIFGYVKSNGECFVRATVNGLVISNNIFHLHNLQNLYFALTGTELTIKP